MKTLTNEEKRFVDWDNELRFNSMGYSDAQVINLAKMAIEFAYDNFKELEDIYEGYVFKYEGRITDIALGIDSHLQKNKKNTSSTAIKQFVIDIINTEKYGRGRDGFIFLLYVLKMDDVLSHLATERKNFWGTPRIQFQLLYALFKRKILGFTKEAEMLIENHPKETELKKYARKYIDMSMKQVK